MKDKNKILASKERKLKKLQERHERLVNRYMINIQSDISDLEDEIDILKAKLK